MFPLKTYATIPKTRKFLPSERHVFKTIEFEPDELLQVNEMTKDELIGLCLFCGIRVYNGMPLSVLEEDEMKMAYVVWRAHMISEAKQELMPKIERGIKWLNYTKAALKILTR